uniref:BLE2 protein n=1 Tax=Aegilops tauschii subsp. strangulata TaxID=200361 RepID=A0A453AVY6_AEGTS
MFTRDNNRLDYQLFFNTRGAFRPLGWSGLIVIACFSGILEIILKFLWEKHLMKIDGSLFIAVTVALLALGRSITVQRALKLLICNPMRRAASVWTLWSPLVAIVLLAPSISIDGSMIELAVFEVLLLAVLVTTISNLRFTRISKLVDSVLGSKQEFWRKVTINLCMIVALGMLVMLNEDDTSTMIAFEVCALLIVSFGNLQIPAAVVRVMLALNELSEPAAYDESVDGQKNIKASLRIFYGMVLGQGILYAVACMFEFFSFIPRRSLIRGGGFKGQWGMKSVNMYYAYASEKCMQGGVLAPKKINLSTFAMDSVNSDSSKNQLAGIRMMHNFLQSQPTKAQLLSKLATSTKTMARIIRMLDWTSPKDTAIRLYAAKVTAELAKNLRAGTIPGTMQLVSALLDADRRLERGNPLLDTDDEHERRQDPVLNTEDSREVADNQFQTQGQLRDTDILLETESRSTQEVGMNKQNSCVLRCWQHISEFWSIPKEQLRTDHDLLPALAMSIIESLAGVDQDNCVEISKAADLVPKIIRFTICRSDTMNTKAQQEILLKSSLKVLQRLTSIGGETGITLRYKISKHPFLLSNLSGILGDDKSSQISRKLVAGILRNIAVDEKTRQEIGRFQMIITKLMQAFLYSEGTMSTNDDHLSRKVAGQALAMLTIQSAQNCLVILKEPWFMKELKILIHDKRYIYVAASLLRNLCLHARSELRESDLKELSHTLREVLERILDADGAELEILIGLSSQICKVIPEDFTRELDAGQIKQRFAKRLVDTLKANMKPSAHCPGIRRAVLEQVIHLMEYNSRYADCFNAFGMTDALSMVEQTPSKAENYRLFLGDEGFMEYSMPLSDLVARAKELMGYNSHILKESK